MTIKKITYYLQGHLDENNAIQFWEDLLRDPEWLEFLKLYRMYLELYGRKKSSEHS